MGEAVAFPSPLPRIGEVFVDPRDDGRALRVSWHPENRQVVLSLWRDDFCIATHRLPATEVARLVQALVEGLAGVPGAPEAQRPAAPTG